MTRVIDELISKNTPLTKQVELIKTMRAFSCIGEGPAYNAMVAHPATLLYLVEALDPDKSYDQETKLQLQTESLWILTNLSIE